MNGNRERAGKSFSMTRLYFLFLSFICFSSSVEAEPVFTEQGRNIIVWNDLTVPEDKTYEAVVIMSGDVDFFGKASHLVLVNGSVRLMKGSELSNKPTVLSGRIEQMAGALIADQTSSETEETFWSEWNDEFQEYVHDLRDFFNSQTTLKWLALPLMVGIPIAIGAVIFLIAALFLIIAPDFAKRAEWNLRQRPIGSLIWGFGAYVLFLPLVVLMALSIVGIPLIPFFVLFALLVIFAGLIAGCLAVGRLILSFFGIQSYIGGAALGIITVTALHFIPWIGPICGSIIWIAGGGGILRSLAGKDASSTPTFTAFYRVRPS
jgi:hypothetical protein